MGRKDSNAKARIAFLLFILMIISLLSVHLYVKNNSDHILYNAIRKLLAGRNDIYSINYDKVNIDLIGKFITVKNLSVSLNKKITEINNKKRNFLIEANIPFVSVTGFSFFDLILRGDLNIDKIYIKKGNIKYYSLKKNLEKNTKTKKINQKQISIKNLSLENSDLEIFSHSFLYPTSSIRGITFSVKNIKIVHGKFINKSILKNKLISEISAKRLFIRFPSTEYTVETGKINFSFVNQELTINKLSYIPENTRRKILQKGSFHKFKIKKILLKEPDVSIFGSKKRISAKELLVFKPEIVIFRDRNIKIIRGKKSGKLPQQIFRQTKLKLGLDTIRIINGNVIYKELAIGQSNEGAIFFTKLNSTLLNISNFPEVIRSGIESKITASAYLMGKSLFKVVMLVPINNKRDQFSFSGSLNKTDLRILNNYLRKNIRIQINRGVIKSMKFSVKADKYKASGIMKLIYNNFKVTLLRKNEPRKKRKFRTFLANTFIHRNNPGKGNKNLRIGKIKFNREVKRSLFNYMWHCLLSGIKSSIKL